MIDLGLLGGLGNMPGSMGIAQARACREAVAEIESLTAERDALRETVESFLAWENNGDEHTPEDWLEQTELLAAAIAAQEQTNE